MPSPPVHVGHCDDEALLLVESLLHELIAVGTLTIDRALAVVEIAVDARDQIYEARDGQDSDVAHALDAILATLRSDRPFSREVDNDA